MLNSRTISIISSISGSENGERRPRPKSEFIAPSAIYRVPLRKNIHRPRSMEMMAQNRADGVPDDDSQSLPNMRKASVASSKSTGLCFSVFNTVCCFTILILVFVSLSTVLTAIVVICKFEVAFASFMQFELILGLSWVNFELGFGLVWA